MKYYTYNEEGRYTGNSGAEPNHNNWTLTPYLGGLIKEKCVDNEWVESYIPITDEDELRKISIAEIKAKYEFHRANGWNAYQEFRALIVLDVANALITETQAFLIEKDLRAGYDRISQNGDWKTAYYELSQIIVSYPFIQSYMDIALSYILDYIANNYDS